MNLEKPLQEYLDEALTTDNYIACEMSFHRDITGKELDYMNEQLKPKGVYLICFHCDTCVEYSKGKEPYHIDRLVHRG
ncbi:hypothetical protein PQE73_gp100 [Bacillus phage vB_BanS_MrDarsey]|uniref:Uncharacterized protein n=1 Tax=Bacillus phage vB_BanS_MrDarsey TaxID=2894787 RepID=A0AAE8YT41_9CAUD|nr:hypothetical protein PQE73_gp100 [Bacillus phage vB_BanS_MrDarsey]UGO47932.1 hypothetical protein MRDARSEY_100 [Bacillus phage vB_BanS_MrDarsey]